MGAPQVNYRESISKMADIKHTHKKQSGGSGQFAEVAIRFEPGEPGSGFEFRSEIKGGVVRLSFLISLYKITISKHVPEEFALTHTISALKSIETSNLEQSLFLPYTSHFQLFGQLYNSDCVESMTLPT